MSSTQPQPPSNECTQAQEAILALLDNEFIAEQQALLAEHLPLCSDCQEYQEAMQHLTLSLRKMEVVPVPKGLEQRIMKRIEAGEEKVKFSPVALVRPRRGAWMKSSPVAAAVLALALALPLIYQASFRPTLDPQQDQPTNQTVAQGQHPASQTPKPSTPSVGPSIVADKPADEPLGNPQDVPVSPSEALQSTNNGTAPSDTQPAQTPPAIASNSIATAETSQHSATVNHSEVASALPTSLNLDSTYASSTEGDVYYDPVSNLVEF